METSLFILFIFQTLNIFIYRWVGKVFISQPRYNHPMIFHNKAARNILVTGPYFVMLVLIILAFVTTNSPWLFLGYSAAGFIVFSVLPNPDVMS